MRFQREITVPGCVFNVITLVQANQRNYWENATTCSKRTLKTLVATQLKFCFVSVKASNFLSDIC